MPQNKNKIIVPLEIKDTNALKEIHTKINYTNNKNSSNDIIHKYTFVQYNSLCLSNRIKYKLNSTPLFNSSFSTTKLNTKTSYQISEKIITFSKKISLDNNNPNLNLEAETLNKISTKLNPLNICLVSQKLHFNRTNKKAQSE